MSFSFDAIDFSSYCDNLDNNTNTNTNTNTNSNSNNSNVNIYIINSKDLIKTSNNQVQYDKTTNETYRIKRLYKIDPITDTEVIPSQCFEFKYKWNPYNGIRMEIDKIGPLCFNAINLYDYYYINRYKGLWTPPQDGFQGMYGDIVGSGKVVNVKSRGAFPERYLFRLPIIDCYLPSTHNMSIITMGPELTENEITEIDAIITKHHSKKSNPRFASLTTLKYYYDRALDISPDPDSDDIKELKAKYPKFTENEINAKYNRYFVDKLVNLKY